MWGPFIAVMLTSTWVSDDPAQELLPPIRLEAAGKPIDTEVYGW